MLHAATIGGNAELVQIFVAEGADVNAKDDHGWTPLHFAVEKQRVAVVKRLIELQANMELRNDEGDTPLAIAARKRFRYKDMVDLLIAKGAKVDAAVGSLLKTGLMPLHEAAKAGDAGQVQLLVSSGSNVNARDEQGRRPLHHAAASGRKETAELLIANGADVNATSEDGCTPLHAAASEGQRELVELLLDRGADIGKQYSDAATSLSLAITNGYREVVELLLARGADVTAGCMGRYVSLDDAANKSFAELAEYLVAEYGPYSIIVADPNSARQLLAYWKIAFDDIWIPEDADLEGFDAAVRARLTDPTEIKAKSHFSRTFILRYFDQYSREYSGIIRNGQKYVICQMILPRSFPNKAPDNAFTMLHGFANGVVRVVFEPKTKTVVEIDCEYWM
jgi:ankyrin repeat protein